MMGASNAIQLNVFHCKFRNNCKFSSLVKDMSMCDMSCDILKICHSICKKKVLKSNSLKNMKKRKMDAKITALPNSSDKRICSSITDVCGAQYGFIL